MKKTAADLLLEASNTFRERNAVYGDNYLRVGAVMRELFPDGMQLRTAEEFNKWHLFELMIVKLTRFVNSGLTHEDSIRDLVVYGSMVESLVLNEGELHVERLRKSDLYKESQK